MFAKTSGTAPVTGGRGKTGQWLTSVTLGLLVLDRFLDFLFLIDFYSLMLKNIYIIK